jgi:hypothetical protein
MIQTKVGARLAVGCWFPTRPLRTTREKSATESRRRPKRNGLPANTDLNHPNLRRSRRG